MGSPARHDTRPRFRAALRLGSLVILANVFAACGSRLSPAAESASSGEVAGNTAAASPSSVTAPDGPTASSPRTNEPLPTLRTGTLEPTEYAPLTGSIRATYQASDAQYWEIELSQIQSRQIQYGPSITSVVLDNLDGAIAVIDHRGAVPPHFLIRQVAPAGEVPTQLTGTAFGPPDGMFGAASAFAPFRATGLGKVDPELPRRFAAAFSDSVDDPQRWQAETSFHDFASGRIFTALLGKAGQAAAFDASPLWRESQTDLERLMGTTSGALSLQEALQRDRGLNIGPKAGPRTIPIAEVAGPSLVEHPFAVMTAALPSAPGPAAEPLAGAVPAEHWYVRFADIRDMLRVLDEADAWLTSVLHILGDRPLVYDLIPRYQRQLGLRRSGLAKALGHHVVSRLAIHGSDPYLREGSDVTFVFELANPTLFDGEIARHLAHWRGEIPQVSERTLEHQGHTITVTSDPRHLIHQHRATLGNLAIISNSEAACKRTLDAILGRRPRLSDEPDLGYMLARDPGEHDAFAFLGDRFIAAVVGPAQKVLEARRMQTLAELSTPGYAAMLFGWLNGREPSNTEELIQSGILSRGELKHQDGSPITFTPGEAATSQYGHVGALVPLIDLPAVTHVSHEEEVAYGGFARSYQDIWRQFIDPIAIRLDIDESAGQARARLDVRVLPLLSGSRYGELLEIVGKARIEAQPVRDGVQVVWGIGQDARIRGELDTLAQSFTGDTDLNIGWLGDWVAVGALDRRAIPELIAWWDDKISLPRTPSAIREVDELNLVRLIGRLPIYAIAEVRNPGMLVATLAALRATANKIAPGMTTWEPHSKHAGVDIVRIGLAAGGDKEFSRYSNLIALYYAQAGGTFAVSLDLDTLHTVIDRMGDASQRPRPGKPDGAQFAIFAALPAGGPASTAALWALQMQAVYGLERARAYAEALLRARPTTTKMDPDQFAQLARAYFGAVPVTPESRHDFYWGPDGPHDPVHGSALAPSFPALPVAGDTPLGVLMSRLVSAQASIAFDQEPAQLSPPALSLHTRLEFTLGDFKEPLDLPEPPSVPARPVAQPHPGATTSSPQGAQTGQDQRPSQARDGVKRPPQPTNESGQPGQPTLPRADQPTPARPTPTKPRSAQPTPTQPRSARPAPTQPRSARPAPTQPIPAQPRSTQPPPVPPRGAGRVPPRPGAVTRPPRPRPGPRPAARP